MKEKNNEKSSEYQLISEILKENLQNDQVFFIFPSEITAKTWAEKSLFLSNQKAIQSNRFLAWDSFKGTAIRSEKQNKKSIPGLLRKLFVENLLEDSNNPFFKVLIPQEWAKIAPSFTSWITSLLPQLNNFKESIGYNENKKSLENQDEENQDLLKLEKTYSDFLEKNGLFEPAWEKPPFHDDGKTYFVFFPDILSDYDKYINILKAANNVKLVNTPPKSEFLDKVSLIAYNNSREEIRKTALFIESLLEKDYEYNEIAIHVPEIEEIAAYLCRELTNRNIPYQLRSGKALSLYEAGSLFSAMQKIKLERFSFNSLKQLLLNTYLPWKENISELIHRLLNFGMEYNCFCGYEKNKEWIDSWEEAFKDAYDEVLITFYRSLKKSIEQFSSSKSFSALRKSYFEFREKFFDMKTCTIESNVILSRCISELLNCIDIEESYKDIIVKNPLSFFCSHLENTEYLGQQEKTGVHIFPYKVAVATPFRQHILINAGQKQVSVLYQPLQFLLKTKREKLGIEDTNVSEKYLSLYSMGNLRCSFSEKTFSRYALPHTDFKKIHIGNKTSDNKNIIAEEEFFTINDSYTLEKNFFSFLQESNIHNHSQFFQNITANEKEKNAFPPLLYKTQKQSFSYWIKAKTQNPKHFYNEKNPGSFSLEQKSFEDFFNTVVDKDTKLLKISATNLNTFFFCPMFFLLKRYYKLKKESYETELLAAVFLGQIYHAILEEFFLYYKNSNECLPSPLTEDDPQNNTQEPYLIVLDTSFQKIINGFPKSVFPRQIIPNLSREVFLNQAAAFKTKLQAFLKYFLSYFHGSKVLETEAWHESAEKTHILVGKIDLVLKTSNDEIWIIDFKTGKTPNLNNCLVNEEGELSDFQLSFYTRLYEKTKSVQVQGAAFSSINENRIYPMIGFLPKTEQRSSIPYSENKKVLRNLELYSQNSNNTNKPVDFNKTLEALDYYIQNYSKKINGNEFALDSDIPFSNCLSCEYNTVCRTSFRVSGDKRAAQGLRTADYNNNEID